MKYLNKLLKLTSIFSLSFILFSCITASEVNLIQEKGEFLGLTKFEDYRFQKNDEVFCTIITKESEFANIFNGILASSSQGSIQAQGGPIYTIYENGYISIPYFGDIKLEGLTIPEAEQVIQEKMTYSVPDAQVRVQLANKRFAVVSSNSQNGVYYIYKDNMTIYQALAITGQPNDLIDFRKVKIVRLGKDGHTYEKSFDLRSAAIIESEFYYIKPNDVIVYSTSKKKSFFQIRSAQQLISGLTATVVTVLSYIAITK